MTVGKRVPEEQYFINTICVTAHCVFVWLSPGMQPRVGMTQSLPVLAQPWVLPGAGSWGQGLPRWAGGTGRSCWSGQAKLAWLGRRLHDPSRAMDLSALSAALMGSAGSEQSKANEVGNKIKNGRKSQPGIGGDTQLPPAGLDHPPQGTTNSC